MTMNTLNGMGNELKLDSVFNGSEKKRFIHIEFSKFSTE